MTQLSFLYFGSFDFIIPAQLSSSTLDSTLGSTANCLTSQLRIPAQLIDSTNSVFQLNSWLNRKGAFDLTNYIAHWATCSILAQFYICAQDACWATSAVKLNSGVASLKLVVGPVGVPRGGCSLKSGDIRCYPCLSVCLCVRVLFRPEIWFRSITH